MAENLSARAPDPEGFERRVAQYLEWLHVNHYSEETRFHRGHHLRHFVGWCGERELTRPSEVTRPLLERYQAAVFYHKKSNGEPLSLQSQRTILTSIRIFFRWLARQNYLLANPASEWVLPRFARRLPKYVLTQEEVERVINVPDVATPLGLRDRAILETFYSTGMRRMELIGLRLDDVDRERGTVMIREGKGRKQRVIPIGARALAWVDKYLAEVRPTLATEPDEGRLFLTHKGRPFFAGSITQLAQRYVQQADIGKRGSAHVFRHTCATLMLEGGADIRFIQAMLGHALLNTTQIYAQVSIAKLKEVHTATHPARLSQPEAPPPPAE